MANRRIVIYLIIIASLLTGVWIGRDFFFNIAYLFGGLLLIAYTWAWASVRWIGISRKTRAHRAQVGRKLEEAFTIHNRSIFPKLWLEVRDHSNFPNHRAGHVVPIVGPRGRYRWYVDTPCLARGEFRLGPLTIASGDPFGLFFAPRKISATSSIIVYPATVPIERFELPTGVLSGGEARRQRTHFITTNAVGVREYVPGDSYNRIHWRTSARRNKLMVKEFELDPLVNIYLLVDFSLSSLYEASDVQRLDGDGPALPSGKKIPSSTEEYSVVIAASLTTYFVELKRALGFIAYTPAREFIEADRGERQLTRILQLLATARSRSPYSLAEVLSLETPRLSRGTTLVIVTASTDPTWVHEAQILIRRGVRPVCVLIDPESFGADASIDDVQVALQTANIPTSVVRQYDDLTTVLAQRNNF